ncbi:MAG: hypothetical protein IPP14_05685 [Planctomycetes bacterium]|nr:hypothetical protein [Planctomycetota bacterium]
MNIPVVVLRPLGECAVGDFLAVEIDGQVFEGTIQFLARAPRGGWILTFCAEAGTWEIFACDGHCTVVSQIVAEEAALQWTFESARTVADTGTGRRLLHWRRPTGHLDPKMT